MQALWPGGDSVSTLRGNQLAGSILGQALGDALGFVVEAQPPEVARVYVEGWLREGRAGEWSHPEFPFGQYTDDTQLARELLRSYREARGWNPAVFAALLAELFQRGLDVGAGQGTRSAALRLLGGTPWTDSGTPSPYAGNGAAMRAGPLGLLAVHRALMCRIATEQARVTHLDPRCAAGAAAIACAVSLAGSNQIEASTFIDDVSQCAGQEDAYFAEAVLGLREWLCLTPPLAARRVHESGLDSRHSQRWEGISAFVVPSVLWSLYSFLRSPDDYWETICTAIGVGGDTDTMAAMAGAISGARLGVAALPADLLARLNDRGTWGAIELVELAEECVDIVSAEERRRKPGSS